MIPILCPERQRRINTCWCLGNLSISSCFDRQIVAPRCNVVMHNGVHGKNATAVFASIPKLTRNSCASLLLKRVITVVTIAALPSSLSPGYSLRRFASTVRSGKIGILGPPTNCSTESLCSGLYFYQWHFELSASSHLEIKVQLSQLLSCKFLFD